MKQILSTVIALFAIANTEAQMSSYVKEKAVMWEMTKPNDENMDIKFGSRGVYLGNEATAVIITNPNEYGVKMKLAVKITDFCGEVKDRSFEVKVNAKETIGKSAWLGGVEQYDYSTACKEKKEYTTGSYTKIASVDITILSMEREGQDKAKIKPLVMLDTINKVFIKATTIISGNNIKGIIVFRNTDPRQHTIITVISEDAETPTDKVKIEKELMKKQAPYRKIINLPPNSSFTYNVGSVKSVAVDVQIDPDPPKEPSQSFSEKVKHLIRKYFFNKDEIRKTDGSDSRTDGIRG